jgi:hypothetical protein
MPREIAVEIDTVGVTARPGGKTVRVQDRYEPEIDTARDGERPQHCRDRYSRRLVAVDTPDDEHTPRFREEYRRNGGELRPAVGDAMNTAGRAVIFAGTTVVIALLGMFALGLSLLNGVAVSASLSVLLVLAASLTIAAGLAHVLRSPDRSPRVARPAPHGTAPGPEHVLDTVDWLYPATPVGGVYRLRRIDACARRTRAQPAVR